MDRHKICYAAYFGTVLGIAERSRVLFVDELLESICTTMNTRLHSIARSLLLSTLFLFASAAGCSFTDSNESTFDPSTEQLRRVTNQVPTFGGVLFEQDQLVVFVLGEKQIEAAEDSLRGIFGADAAQIKLEVRPPEGNASEELKQSSRNVLSVETARTLGFDETTGYLRVGVTEVKGVRQAKEKLQEIGTPLEEVILQVQSPITAL